MTRQFELKRTSAQHSMEKINLNLFYKRQQEEELARDRQRMEKAERDLADAQRQLQERFVNCPEIGFEFDGVDQFMQTQTRKIKIIFYDVIPRRHIHDVTPPTNYFETNPPFPETANTKS